MRIRISGGAGEMGHAVGAARTPRGKAVDSRRMTLLREVIGSLCPDPDVATGIIDSG